MAAEKKGAGRARKKEKKNVVQGVAHVADGIEHRLSDIVNAIGGGKSP